MKAAVSGRPAQWLDPEAQLCGGGDGRGSPAVADGLLAARSRRHVEGDTRHQGMRSTTPSRGQFGEPPSSRRRSPARRSPPVPHQDHPRSKAGAPSRPVGTVGSSAAATTPRSGAPRSPRRDKAQCRAAAAGPSPRSRTAVGVRPPYRRPAVGRRVQISMTCVGTPQTLRLVDGQVSVLLNGAAPLLPVPHERRRIRQRASLRLAMSPSRAKSTTLWSRDACARCATVGGSCRYFGERANLTDITPRKIADFIGWLCNEDEQGRRLSDSTVSNALDPVRSCLASAAQEGLIRTNPCHGASLPHSGRPRGRRRAVP